MAPSPSSYGGNGPLTIRIVVAEFVVTSIILFLRCFATISIVKKARWDLIWIIASYLCSANALAFVILSVHHGMSNHVADVDPADLPDAVLFEWIFNVSTIMATGFGKFAIAALLLEVQGPTHNKMRKFLYFVVGSTMTLAVFMTIFSWFQCSPQEKLWKSDLPGTCNLVWPVLYAGVFQGSWSTASDFILAAYPAWIFWHLETSWRRKLGLCGLFAGGAVAGVAAILKTINISRLGNTVDPTWAIYDLIVWASTEMWLIVIMSSIPPLRPLFVRFYRSAKEFSGHRSRPTYGGEHSGSFDRTAEIDKFQRSLRPDLGGKVEARSGQRSESMDDILLKDVGMQDNGAILVTRDMSVKSSEAGSAYYGKKMSH